MRRALDERALLTLIGVDESAPWEEVRRAFRIAVRNSHPDLHFGDPEAEQRLKALNAAWEAINTPDKWASYTRRASTGGASGGDSRAPARGAVPAFARLRVKRQLRGAIGMVNWSLELDGKVIASIENGATMLIDVKPGRRTLRVFYGSRSSPPLQVDLQRGQELSLGCRDIESLKKSLFSPKRSLVLERLDNRPFG